MPCTAGVNKKHIASLYIDIFYLLVSVEIIFSFIDCCINGEEYKMRANLCYKDQQQTAETILIYISNRYTHIRYVTFYIALP